LGENGYSVFKNVKITMDDFNFIPLFQITDSAETNIGYNIGTLRYLVDDYNTFIFPIKCLIHVTNNSLTFATNNFEDFFSNLNFIYNKIKEKDSSEIIFENLLNNLSENEIEELNDTSFSLSIKPSPTRVGSYSKILNLLCDKIDIFIPYVDLMIKRYGTKEFQKLKKITNSNFFFKCALFLDFYNEVYLNFVKYIENCNNFTLKLEIFNKFFELKKKIDNIKNEVQNLENNEDLKILIFSKKIYEKNMNDEDLDFWNEIENFKNFLKDFEEYFFQHILQFQVFPLNLFGLFCNNVEIKKKISKKILEEINLINETYLNRFSIFKKNKKFNIVKNDIIVLKNEILDYKNINFNSKIYKTMEIMFENLFFHSFDLERQFSKTKSKFLKSRNISIETASEIITSKNNNIQIIVNDETEKLFKETKIFLRKKESEKKVPPSVVIHEIIDDVIESRIDPPSKSIFEDTIKYSLGKLEKENFFL